MADRIVRSLRRVEDIDRLADFLTEENDLISTSDGHIYVRTDSSYYKLTFYNDLKTLIDKYSGQIDKHDIAINDNKEKISTFLEKIKKFQPMIDSNKKEIDSLKEKDVILNESLEQHQTQLNEFEKSMLQYDDKYETLTQSLNATKDSVGRNTDEINFIKANTGAENIDTKIAQSKSEIEQNFDKKINSAKLQFNDTGWQDVQLESGIVASDSNGGYPAPQYRIVTINGFKTIQLKGVLKGIKKNGDIKLGTINAKLKSTHHYTQCAIDNKMINTRLYLNFNNELHFVTSNYSDSELSNGDKRFAIDTQIIE